MRIAVVIAALALVGCDDGGSEAAQMGADLGQPDQAVNDQAVNDRAVSDRAVSDQAVDAGPGEPEPMPEPMPEPQPEAGPDLDMTAADFDCMLDWPAVRRFRITNKLGMLDETLAVANDPAGGTYPPGTVIQLVPQEAMVKRARGWNPLTNDWEFFFLDIGRDGAVSIRTRGAEETVNAFGGNCFECHSKAEPRWDLVCEQDHGCDPLPFGPEVIRGIQEMDARCR